MAEENKTKLEREYVIPLRREWLKVAQYRRAGRAAKAIKQFIAKHMKVPDRDVDKVKVDMYLNNEVWSRGKRSPPSRIKVRAIKEGDIVRVEFVEIPEHVKFLKSKNERFHKEAEKKEEKPAEKTAEKTEQDKKETAEEKKVEVEKEKAGEEKQIKEAKTEAKADKHTQKKKAPEIRRTSMNRH